MLTHDFPLRPDLIARLVLPRDLTLADAERVAKFVKALVFPIEPEPALHWHGGCDDCDRLRNRVGVP